MFEDLLFTLSIRFFFFDFVLFKVVRQQLEETHYFFKKLFSCTFCQGFWCGIVVFLFNNQVILLPQLIQFAFISAFLTLTWSIATYPLLKKYEEDHDAPTT